MAQRDAKLTITKAKPTSRKLQTSLSHPASSNVIEKEQPNARRHLTLPVPLNDNSSQSAAERYIASRTQMFSTSSEQTDTSPDSPSSIPSSACTGTTISLVQTPMSHSERMNKWHEEQVKKLCKKQKHRYVYGTPPASSSTSLSSPQFSIPMLFSSSRQANNTIQLSTNPTCTIKKDKNMIERSKINETHEKMKLFSAV